MSRKKTEANEKIRIKNPISTISSEKSLASPNKMTYCNSTMVERILVGALHTNCYVFFSGKKECFLIDPGEDSGVILKRVLALNLVPKVMIFTHGHLDHTAAAQDIRVHHENLGVQVKIAVHETDAHFFGSKADKIHRKSFAALGAEGLALFSEMYRGVPEADILLKDGDNILDSDLKVIHTPGHSAGSICLYSESRGILFTGDTLFCEGVGRTDIPGGSQKDLLDSIRNKLYSLPPETRIFPGHGPQSTLEREMHHNPFIRLG